MNVAQAIGQAFLKKGIQQGIRQGIQQGVQQGAYDKALHIARNMLHSNEPKEKVHQFTGLSWMEIERLAKEKEKVQD